VPGDFSPKISIVTPSYKQLSWLKLCAASIADQEGVSFEYIIQDANTGPELEEWVRENTPAQLFVEKDGGMYDAINRGLRRGKGEICAYLNCDEQYLPGTLRRVADYFDQHPEVDVLFGDAILTDPELEPLSYRRVILPTRLHTLVRPLGVLTCATFYRRKLIDEDALFDTSWRIIGDRAWILALIERGYRLAVLHEPTSVFALTGANLSNHPSVNAEYARWKTKVSPMIKALKPMVLGQHLLAKWNQGAYVDRPIDTAWYTWKSFPKRRNFSGMKLGWKWPILAEKEPS
jgi:glycosyltransferase involved in cell wall biosynthesis